MSCTLYGIKNCDTVKKARAFLTHQPIDYTFVDFKQTPPTLELIQTWESQVGMDVLFNAKSRTFRELGLSVQNLDNEKKRALLVAHPLLIKRPVWVYNENIIIGFNEQTYQGALKI